MSETLITGQTSIHESKPRVKIDISLYKKSEEEKQRIKDLKKAYKNSLKCSK
jgi:hypothetical protein